ncbi:DUF4157 domain-containing protein [Fulvivirga ulvae]|uniref:eCIS core domain-containing protein n=1 Tax=Fulvivirga ulvae TaxID=2904245 RepID=UPI001F46ADCD|nr:DUF4157 domain-containing protein [Fulvivirga ulvae]UII29854.1 DUF4157 domain-containing protein [Fulvivirga ulvae]
MKDNLSSSRNNTAINNLNLNKNSLSGSSMDRNIQFPDNLSKGNFQGATTQLKKGQSSDQMGSIRSSINNTGLPDHLKAGIENLSGYAMDDVNVHYNSPKPAQLKAHAYAQGTDIHVAPGQEQHLPHEAWHVVQQKQGRVQPTMQMKGGVNVNDDAGLEKEADTMGAKAAQMKGNSTSTQRKTAEKNTNLTTKQLAAANTIQMAVDVNDLDLRYQHWLQYNNTDGLLAYINGKTNGNHNSIDQYMQAGTTTKDEMQKHMRNFVGKSAIDSTKEAIASFGNNLPNIRKNKFKNSPDFKNKEKLRSVGVHAVTNTFNRELANLQNNTKLYHCTKAAQAIMNSEMRGGSGIRDGGNFYQLDPSLIGRISFTTNKDRKMVGHDQLVMTLQAGDIERYGIFHFSQDEYVATKPIPGNRFSKT